MRYDFLSFWGVPCCENMAANAIHQLLISSRLLSEAQSPTQADLLLVFGHITHKQTPYLQNFWAEFAYPARSVHFAGCRKVLRNYALLDNLTDVVAVDLVVDSCELDLSIIEKSLRHLKHQGIS